MQGWACSFKIFIPLVIGWCCSCLCPVHHQVKVLLFYLLATLLLLRSIKRICKECRSPAPQHYLC
jgi:hypothetical protein